MSVPTLSQATHELDQDVDRLQRALAAARRHPHHPEATAVVAAARRLVSESTAAVAAASLPTRARDESLTSFVDGRGVIWVEGSTPGADVALAAEQAAASVALHFARPIPAITWVRPAEVRDYDLGTPALRWSTARSINGFAIPRKMPDRIFIVCDGLATDEAGHVSSHEVAHLVQFDRGEPASEAGADELARHFCELFDTGCLRCAGGDNWLARAQRDYNRDRRRWIYAGAEPTRFRLIHGGETA